jgi:putative membrane protein
MLLYLLLALILGILAGTITGLVPGIHTNLIAALLLSFTFLFPSNISIFLVLITSMAITHTFIDFIPSIYLGAPDEDTGLSTLPGHEFLLKGKGDHAVRLTLIGSVIAIISLIIIIPLFVFILPIVYPYINKMLGWALVWIAILLIMLEKNSKIKSSFIFLMAGFLGIASFNLSIQNPLLPMLTGLFGASTIIFSLKKKTFVPEQNLEKISISKKELVRPTIATIIISPICAIFPGLGASQAAVIGSHLTGKQSKEQFLILLGSINTLIISLSFIILFLLQKNRTGAASTISQITTLTIPNITLIIITIFLTTFLTIPITIFLSKIFAKNIHKIPYHKISLVVLAFLTLIVFIFTSYIGLLIFISSTLLGLTCIELGTRKGFLMGSLLVPTILFYLPI